MPAIPSPPPTTPTGRKACVKDQLGHSSIQMTVDVYGHLIPGMNKQAVDKLDDHASSAGGAKKQAELYVARVSPLAATLVFGFPPSRLHCPWNHKSRL